MTVISISSIEHGNPRTKYATTGQQESQSPGTDSRLVTHWKHEGVQGDEAEQRGECHQATDDKFQGLVKKQTKYNVSWQLFREGSDGKSFRLYVPYSLSQLLCHCSRKAAVDNT